MRRAWTAALLLAAAPAGAMSLEFLGQATLAPGLEYAGTVVGGLSALDYEPETGGYVAISDDRSDHGPARYYRLLIGVGPGGVAGMAPVGVTLLRQPDGATFPQKGIDPEGLRRTAKGTYLYSSEGDANTLIAPFVREMRADGTYIRDFEIAAKYLPAQDKTRGIRFNLAFESLTIAPGGRLVFAATENALVQDGPAATLTEGSPARIIRFDAVTGKPTGEFVYVTDKVAAAPTPADALATNGLTELLALSDTRFIAIERSFSAGAGHVVKLYEVDVGRATNVIGLDSLKAARWRPAAKTLLLDLGRLAIELHNLEGLTLGPTLPDGRRTLLVIADNNFTPGEVTQLLAFAVR